MSSDRKSDLKIPLYLVFAFILSYQEILLQAILFRSLTWGMLYATLLALPAGLVMAAVCGIFPRKLNRAIAVLLLFLQTFLIGTQLVYYHIFKCFMMVASLGNGVGNALDFVHVVVRTLLTHWWEILLLLLPVVLYLCIPFLYRRRDYDRKSLKVLLIYLLIAAALHVAALLALRIPGTGKGSPYDQYFNTPTGVKEYRSLGVVTCMRRDTLRLIFKAQYAGQQMSLLDEETGTAVQDVDSSIPENSGLPIDPAGDSSAVENSTGASESSVPQPEETVFIPEPNVLDLDFAALAESAPNSTVADLHRYFGSQKPTMTNEYTGMFEGYNLIWIIAESFSPWAVDEERTPTLYKLVNSGFVFENFYTPYYYLSTSDGEYVTINSLLPKEDIWSFYHTAYNQMPFSIANVLSSIGYVCRGYHAHDYDFFDRDLSHPNIGYIWKARGNGLYIDESLFPESDVEMMELTIPEYINDEPFHTYYLTISAHFPYNYAEDDMAQKYWSYVEDLPYTEGIKAYFAANMELDRALEYLLAQLEEAGVADHTLIAMTADHYPYGLSDAEMDTLNGYTVDEYYYYYRNHFVLYCPGMEETIVIDKPGCNLDVAPTICNLMNIPYDSRLMMGTDLLSDSEPLVIFGDHSFLNDRFLYNTLTDVVTSFTGEEPSQEEVDALIRKVENKFTVSAAVLDNDYYAYLADSLPWWDGTAYGHLYDPEKEDSHAD